MEQSSESEEDYGPLSWPGTPPLDLIENEEKEWQRIRGELEAAERQRKDAARVRLKAAWEERKDKVYALRVKDSKRLRIRNENIEMLRRELINHHKVPNEWIGVSNTSGNVWVAPLLRQVANEDECVPEDLEDVLLAKLSFDKDTKRPLVWVRCNLPSVNVKPAKR